MHGFVAAGSSVLIMLFNKAVMSVFGFKFLDVLALLHMSTCLLFLSILKNAGFLKFRDFDFTTAKRVGPTVLLILYDSDYALRAL
jgi:hypothetical protein